MRRYRVLAALAALAFVAAPGLAPPAVGQAAPPVDAVAALAAQLKAGTARPLAYSGPDKGYAPDLLRRLSIGEDSQVLVFSRTSLQVGFIAPRNPRAIYFNDDVALGVIPGAPLIELWAVGRDGVVRFYTIRNEARYSGKDAPRETVAGGRPALVHETDECELCHSSINPAAPGPLTQSVTTLESGTFLFANTNRMTDARTPIAERWGGWYVTGQHGAMHHRGNVVVKSSAEAELPTDGRGQNLTALNGRFDLARYSRPTSDIVALMTLEHETGFVNLAGAVRVLSEAGAKAEPAAMDEAVAALADYMLGVDGAPLTSPVKGVSGFAERFAAEGAKDGQGRSLRAFDLRTRLFRYPVSYMIYSQAFETLPAAAKARVYARLGAVLSGRDASAKYAGLAKADRQAAAEIVAATKGDVPAGWPLKP